VQQSASVVQHLYCCGSQHVAPVFVLVATSIAFPEAFVVLVAALVAVFFFATFNGWFGR
jgi:hypothetical protein